MIWLRRHSWWGLVATSGLLALFGITDMAVGADADPGIPLGLIGLSPAELKAESEAGYRILDFFTRTQGLALLIVGTLAAAVLLFAYRRDQRWSWWTMWVLPAWSASVFMFYVLVGVDSAQPPPPPMISSPILMALTAAIQLVSAPRFFR
jgi:hypothetical protein